MKLKMSGDTLIYDVLSPLMEHTASIHLRKLVRKSGKVEAWRTLHK